FWIGVFILLFVGIKPKLLFALDLRIKHIEPFLLCLSIGSTAIFSYLFIFGLQLNKLKEDVTPFYIVLGLVAFLNLAMAFLFGVLSYFDMYGESSLRKILSSLNWPLINWFLNITTVHIMLFVLLLTIIDGLMWVCSTEPGKKRFWNLLWITDFPTLCGMVTIFVIQQQWEGLWGKDRAGTFEAGAVTFQLLAANVQIVASDLIARWDKKMSIAQILAITPRQVATLASIPVFVVFALFFLSPGPGQA